MLRRFSTVVVLSVRCQKSVQPRSSYESKTRGENAQPLARSANSTDVRSIRFDARLRLFRLNSDSMEIDATLRNFLRGNQDTDARSTSDGNRRLRAKIISSVAASVLFQEKRSPRSVWSFDFSLLRFANCDHPCENVSRPFVRDRLFSMDFRISEICETAAPDGTLLDPINSIGFVEG
jgi:hypothetical protein